MIWRRWLSHRLIKIKVSFCSFLFYFSRFDDFRPRFASAQPFMQWNNWMFRNSIVWAPLILRLAMCVCGAAVAAPSEYVWGKWRHLSLILSENCLITYFSLLFFFLFSFNTHQHQTHNPQLILAKTPNWCRCVIPKPLNHTNNLHTVNLPAYYFLRSFSMSEIPITGIDHNCRASNVLVQYETWVASCVRFKCDNWTINGCYLFIKVKLSPLLFCHVASSWD